MHSRRLILGLLLLTLMVTVLAASAKLRTTPKYDRIQVGMTRDEVEAILKPGLDERAYVIGLFKGEWECDEGAISITFTEARCRWRTEPPEVDTVASKSIKQRGPLERLAWLAGSR